MRCTSIALPYGIQPTRENLEKIMSAKEARGEHHVAANLAQILGLDNVAASNHEKAGNLGTAMQFYQSLFDVTGMTRTQKKREKIENRYSLALKTASFVKKLRLDSLSNFITRKAAKTYANDFNYERVRNMLESKGMISEAVAIEKEYGSLPKAAHIAARHKDFSTAYALLAEAKDYNKGIELTQYALKKATSNHATQLFEDPSYVAKEAKRCMGSFYTLKIRSFVEDENYKDAIETAQTAYENTKVKSFLKLASKYEKMHSRKSN